MGGRGAGGGGKGGGGGGGGGGGVAPPTLSKKKLFAVSDEIKDVKRRIALATPGSPQHIGWNSALKDLIKQQKNLRKQITKGGK